MNSHGSQSCGRGVVAKLHTTSPSQIRNASRLPTQQKKHPSNKQQTSKWHNLANTIVSPAGHCAATRHRTRMVLQSASKNIVQGFRFKFQKYILKI
jgi:hypothetical protein